MDHRDPFTTEHVVEAGAEVAVAVVDEARVRSNKSVKLRCRAYCVGLVISQ